MSYLVFSGQHYYPGGGTNDFRGVTKSVEMGIILAMEHGAEWYEVVTFEGDAFNVIAHGYEDVGKWLHRRKDADGNMQET